MAKIKNFRKWLIMLVVFLTTKCVYDSVETNLTIINKSRNPIVFVLTKDTLFGNKMYEYRKNSCLEDDLKKDYVVLPNKEGYVLSNQTWDDLVDKDTIDRYLYIVDLLILDSLKKVESDSIKIRNKSLTIKKYKLRELQDLNWKIEFFGKIDK